MLEDPIELFPLELVAMNSSCKMKLNILFSTSGMMDGRVNNLLWYDNIWKWS